MQVLMGGPVETSRGFVLHSPDFYIDQSTLPIDDSVCLTATIDILRAIARGEGPGERGPGARLCRLGRRTARERDPGERLAQLPGGRGPHLQRAPTALRAGAAQDRHRPGDAVDGSRARVGILCR